jgi:hypothetical protein
MKTTSRSGARKRALESLRDWTNACHKYRHGHNLEVLVEPPLDLTIVLVSNGLNFARWIVALAVSRIGPSANGVVYPLGNQ